MTLKDTNERVVNQTTGLEYEDLAARILGQPKDSDRNRLLKYLHEGGFQKEGIAAFWRAYDACIWVSDPQSTTTITGKPAYYKDKSSAGFKAAEKACAPAKFESASRRALAQSLADIADRIIFDAISGAGSGEPRSSPANTVPPPPDPIHAPN
jgi:hypothetical protein